MKHSLQLKLSQQLTLTPQLQQSIRLLQLSTLELNQELEQFLLENPLLERGDIETDENYIPSNDQYTASSGGEEAETQEFQGSQEDYATEAPDNLWDSDAPNYTGNQDEEGERDLPSLTIDSPTLREHLIAQVNLLNISDRDKTMITLLIDALDEDGYLKQDLEEIAALLPPELEVDPMELSTALKHLKNLDPPGVGARNLSECLVLQLEATGKGTPYREEALQVVTQHLDVLASRDFTKLRKLLHCDEECLRETQKLIVSLNPRPGAEYAQLDTRYIIHDVEVRKIKDKWVARLNPEAMPKLRINRMYADILRRNREASNKQLANQLQEARWLIKNVQQRFDTILRVSQAIVDRQRHFFEHGEVAMRPLVLREIAEAVDLHESTVSRVTTQKFMLTPRGIFELKYFFGSHVATEAGGACSATAIRALIKQLVSAEDSKKPLSDGQIADVLSQQGIIVARRTIAKYRESLQIPPVNLRKSI